MRYIRTAVLALTVAAAPAAAVAAGTMNANAATPSCGKTCVDVFSRDFGTFKHPGFVLDVLKQAQNVGQPVILFRASSSDPAEDFSVGNQGKVSDFYSSGMVSSAVNLHYGCDSSLVTGKCLNADPDDEAYEIQYSPYGADSGLCVGVAGAAVANAKVSLQPCGESARTVWIVDTLDGTPFSLSVPLISGMDTNVSHPAVLTYPSSGYPTDKPRPQLLVTSLTGSAQGSGGASLKEVNDNELWSAVTGKL